MAEQGAEQVSMGIYAGIPYIVVRKGKDLYIGLDAGVAAQLAIDGANLRLLDKIGDQDPDDVMEALLASLPPKNK